MAVMTDNDIIDKLSNSKRQGNGSTDFEYYNILITPSNEYYKQTLVVMLSAILNCKKKCHFYIMQNDWNSKSKDVCLSFFIADHNVNTHENNSIKMQKNIDDLSLQIEKKQSEIFALEAKQHELRKQAEVQSQEIDTLIFQLEEIKKDAKSQGRIYCDEINALKGHIAGIEASRSWKITKPLRSLKSLFTKQKAVGGN